MKNKKASNWELISEGIITASEIKELETDKQPITLVLSNIATGKVGSVMIYTANSKQYKIANSIVGARENPKYKYLSCAVRRAVKEYKSAIRNGWKMTTK